MITRENYEEYIMMYIDGELSSAQEDALKTFLDMHPEYKPDLQAYEHTRIAPDMSTVFTGKNALVKPQPVKRVVSLPTWVKYGMAAGIAAIFLASFFRYLVPAEHSEVAKTGASIIEERKEPNASPPIKSTVTTTKIDTIRPVASIKKENKALVTKTIIKNSTKIISTDQNIASVTTVKVDKIVPAEIKELPAHQLETSTLPAAKVPEYAIAANGPEEKKTFWDKLPIDELKKKELKNISAGVTNTYDEINTVKNSLDDKTLTIKIEKRKLILSF